MKNILRQGSLTVTCPVCNTQFKENPSRIRNGRGKFCSWACLSKWKKMTYPAKPWRHLRPYPVGEQNPRWTGIRAPKPCPICGVIFRKATQTCSAACGHKLTGQSHRGMNNPYARTHPKKEKTCKACGKTFQRLDLPGDAKGAGKYYCSDACRVKSQRTSQRQLHLAKRIEILFNERIQQEKSWPWLKSPLSRQRLRVDIFLPARNVAIEYHGRQHFEPAAFSHLRNDGLAKVQARDEAKKVLLKEHGIHLIEFSGWPIADEAILAALTYSSPSSYLETGHEP